MKPIANGIDCVDLVFQGKSRVIATAVIHSDSGLTLIDPGPSSCLTTLLDSLARRGMLVADIRTILLTHIHLDHAGATGTLVRKNPEIKVMVHERGATHLVDPTRLLKSAGRLYGADMNRLWGEILPVPSTNLTNLEGGEHLLLSGRELEVAYTPGHASHHVAYFDRVSGIAFVGDVAGVRTGSELFSMPPTLPPDLELDAWLNSVECIKKWRPDTLFLTHFGPHGEILAHLQALVKHLSEMSRMVLLTLDQDGDDGDRAERFIEEMRRYIRRYVSEAEAGRYDQAAPLKLCWTGLARYWRKHSAKVSGL